MKGQYPDGLRGPLIVHDPKDPFKGQYDQEIVLTTSDWYHDQSPSLLATMLSASNPHALPPFPESILLNDGQTPPRYNFVAGKTYKFRIISISAFAATFFKFDGHDMTVIEIDGTYVRPHTTDQIRVAPAQRYSVLITAKTDVKKNFAFLTSLDFNRDFRDLTGSPAPAYPFNLTGYLVYDSTKALPAPNVVAKWKPVNDHKLFAYDNQALLQNPATTITLDFSFGVDSFGIPR